MQHHHPAGEETLALRASCDKIVALLGAPNSGKTTLFSSLTGKKRMIANWPGVTVDVAIGVVEDGGGGKTCLLDLPGTYGLTPTSPEEELAVKILLEQQPHIILVVLDSLQPETGLPLLIQAVEAFPGRVLVVLTKTSLAHSQGTHTDAETLARELGVPVVPLSVLEGRGLDELRDHIRRGRTGGRIRVDYGVIEPVLRELEGHPGTIEASETLRVSSRWLTTQLLVGDALLSEVLGKRGFGDLVGRASQKRRELEKSLGMEPRLIVASQRLRFAENLARRVVVRRSPASTGWQRVADAFMHPVVGPLLSVGGLLAIFTVVFTLNTGFPLNLLLHKAGLETLAGLLDNYNINSLLTTLFNDVGHWIEERIGGLAGSFIAHGVFGGVGFVLSFLPLIVMMFLALAILEDSGLAARMAVSLHPLLERFGLTGRSVFPLIMGFGCNVPAVMTMRGLGWEERMRAVFAAPFIPCQARLTVIFAFASVAVLAPLMQSLMVFAVYAVAIAVALATSYLAGIIVSRTTGGKVPVRLPFLLEVPDVHAPHWRVVWWYVRDNTIHFLRKAGTIVFLLALVTWVLLSTGPQGVAESIEDSFGWRIGGVVGGILKPLELDDRTARILGIALLDGLVAKEGVLAAIAVSTSMSSEDVVGALMGLGLSGVQSFAYLLMITLYFPCIATLSSMVTVTNRPRLVALYALYSISVAIGVSIASYKILDAIIG